MLNLAAKEGQVDQVAEGLDDLADAVVTSAALASLLHDPKVLQVQKDAVIAELIKKIKPPEIVNNFVRFLSAKRRITLLDEIRVVYHRLADLLTGRATAVVTVAVPLKKAEEDQLRKKIEAFSGKQITLDVEVDPAILGGAITRIGSTVWDGSLRNQLTSIRDSIIQVGL
jgi:F-type H+-transporting ATPase subunit delta